MKYLFAHIISVLYAICGVLVNFICYMLGNIGSLIWHFELAFDGSSFGFKTIFKRCYNDMLKFLW